MNYFVVMIEYERSREAIVNPEITRLGVVQRIASGEYPRDQIAFIHEVEDDAGIMFVGDVTTELMDEAQAIALQAAE